MTASLPFQKSAEPLDKHCTMRVGGPAAVWLEPNTESELTDALDFVRRGGHKLYVFGNGSNLVPSDAGWGGAILHLGRGFDYSRVEGDTLIAGGAARLPKLTKIAIGAGLGNMEWACGIPGSAGGSLWGNAGSRGFNGEGWETRDCSADLVSLVAFTRDGRRRELLKSDLEFAYRKSSLGELLVTEVRWKLKPLTTDKAAIHKEAVRELLQVRRETQPANAASAGCAWKNPAGCAGAGKLVEECGLKGLTVGGAQVSTLHGNFVINAGDATGADVRNLLAAVEEKVLAATGIRLEREVRLLDD